MDRVMGTKTLRALRREGGFLRDLGEVFTREAVDGEAPAPEKSKQGGKLSANGRE